MATLPNPIMTATQSDGSTNYEGEFGAEAKNVQVKGNSYIENGERSYRWAGSLQEYINNLDDYFSNSSFMYYGSLENNQELPKQVKFWYGEPNNS